MSNLSVVNEITQLYEKPPIKTKSGFDCPVCGKNYKTEKGITKHMSEQDCYSIKHVFNGTIIESNALILFEEIMGNTSNLFVFRRSKLYAGIMKFVVFCMMNEVKEVGTYYAYINECHPKFRSKSHAHTLSFGRKETTLREFRDFLQKNPIFIDTDKFISRYKNDLIEDPKFLIRSIEKAHVSIMTIIQDRELSKAIDDLPIGYYQRLEELYERIAD